MTNRSAGTHHLLYSVRGAECGKGKKGNGME